MARLWGSEHRGALSRSARARRGGAGFNSKLWSTPSYENLLTDMTDFAPPPQVILFFATTCPHKLACVTPLHAYQFPHTTSRTPLQAYHFTHTTSRIPIPGYHFTHTTSHIPLYAYHFTHTISRMPLQYTIFFLNNSIITFSWFMAIWRSWCSMNSGRSSWETILVFYM